MNDKRKNRNSIKNFVIYNHFCAVLRLVCIFHYVLVVDSNFRVLLVCEGMNFFSAFTFHR